MFSEYLVVGAEDRVAVATVEVASDAHHQSLRLNKRVFAVQLEGGVPAELAGWLWVAYGSSRAHPRRFIISLDDIMMDFKRYLDFADSFWA